MSLFSLHSPYAPTGDQPEAIAALAKGVARGDRGQTLLGVTGSGKTFTMANVIAQSERPALVMAHNKTLAAQLAAEFRTFFPDNAVEYFVSYYDYYQPEAYVPNKDLYIAKESQINEEIDRLRHSTVVSLLTRRDVIVVASVSCIYGLGNPNSYRKQLVRLEKGKEIDRAKLLRALVRMQYTRNDIDFHRGTFRVRGDVVEVFPTYGERVFRLDFFGNTLEKIEEVDWLKGNVIRSFDELEIFPASHYATDPNTIKNAIPQIEKELAKQVQLFRETNHIARAELIEQRTRYDLEMLREMGYTQGIENYSRYMDGRNVGEPPYTLLDYFPKDYLLFIDESHMTVPQIGGMEKGDRSRKDMLITHGYRLPSARDNRPLNWGEFASRMGQTIFVSATPREFERDHSTQIVEQIVRPTGIVDPQIDVRPTKHQVDDLAEEIQTRIKKKQRVLVTTLTKRMAEELTDYLLEHGTKVAYIHSDVDTFERVEILRDLRTGTYDVLVGVNLLREGLDLPEVTLVAILDADKEGFLRNATSLIQTIGRAARHTEGKVIMYADKMTDSMKAAIDETNRRRTIQLAYNKKHNITAKNISKAIGEDRLSGMKEVEEKEAIAHAELTADQREELARELTEKMHLAADNLNFEEAAQLRDEIEFLMKKK